ncbi:MAG: hypothetical protein KGL16_00500 [Acidobacteriota bacterium]|nr:hypothetical protein [Acidobacteriota bacterium]
MAGSSQPRPAADAIIGTIAFFILQQTLAGQGVRYLIIFRAPEQAP